MSTTTITIAETEYTLGQPSLMESLRYRAMASALHGEDQILLWFWAFGSLCDACDAESAETVTLQGGLVADWLREKHPGCTPADLWNVALISRDVFLEAFSSPLENPEALTADNSPNGDEAAHLGNSSAGPLKVAPSYKGSGTLVSGSEMPAPPSGP